jgi:hypothetical protein
MLMSPERQTHGRFRATTARLAGSGSVVDDVTPHDDAS